VITKRGGKGDRSRKEVGIIKYGDGNQNISCSLVSGALCLY